MCVDVFVCVEVCGALSQEAEVGFIVLTYSYCSVNRKEKIMYASTSIIYQGKRGAVDSWVEQPVGELGIKMREGGAKMVV